MNGQGDAIESFAFTSASADNIIEQVWSGWKQTLSTATQFAKFKFNMYGVPENYLSVVDTEYYTIDSLEEDAVTSHLPDGRSNGISALFNDIGI